MNWDQIEDNWFAMTRRMRSDWPATKPGDAVPGAPADGAGNLGNEPARTVAEDLKPFAREVA